MKKPLSGLLCALAITWLALFAALALAAEPGVQVKVDFVCRGAPASHDLFSMTILIAGKPLAGTLVYPPAGLQELRIDTGRPDWRVKRIEYLDIAAPERRTVIYQEDSRVASRKLKFTERPSRSVLSNLLIVVDTCSSVSGLPPPPPPPPPPLLPPPPPPPPPPPSPDRAAAPCSQALLTEYDRLLGARVVLRQRLRVVGDSTTQAVLDVGVDSLDRAATQAASTLQGLGRALDEVYLRPLAGRIEAYVKAGVSTSAKRKYDEGDAAGAVLDGVEASALKDEVRNQQQDRQSLQREWSARFAAQGAAARDMLRRLAPTSADTARRLNRQVDDIDLRLNRLRGIADESRCALPTSNLPRDSAYEDARVLLGIHPPLDGTEPAISEEETTLVLQPGFMFTFSSKDAQAAVAYNQARQQLKPITDNDTAAMLWLGSALKAVTSGDIFGGGASVLQQGTVVSATLPRRQAKPVSLVTPEARVTPQGTAYLVHRDARRAMTFVYVTDGLVAIAPSRGAALRLAAGQAALVTASGATALVPGGIRVPTPPTTNTPSNSSFEPDSNRNGSDYANFDLPRADPQLCYERCTGDNSCRAWTYVKPGVRGPNAHCFLKNPAPPATANTCCVSGVVPRIIDQQMNFEVNTNRAGSDYDSFDLATANPDQCFERCKGDNRCSAWTFVRPGVQGSQARCYLKNAAPAPTANTCCVSGTIPRAAAPPPPPVTPPVRLPGGDTRYDNPVVNGVLVDHCASWGANCGQGGADQFCRRQGHGAARSFQVRNPGRTHVLGDNRVCEGGNCVGFTQVVCAGAGQEPPPPPPPPPQGGTCFANSPTFVEQTDKGWQGVYTRRGSSNVFDANYSHPGGARLTGELTLDIVKPGEIRINRYRTSDGYTGVIQAVIGTDGVARGRYIGGESTMTLRCGGAAQSQSYRVPQPPTPPPTPPQPPPSAGLRFDRPAVNGVVVDNCATWGTNCGQGGADQFCRRQGHGRALSFQLFNPGRTWVLGDSRACDGGSCVGFSQVVCAAADSTALPPPPPVQPLTQRLPPPPPEAVVAPAELGQLWTEFESGQQGIWRRRPGTNTFDASWPGVSETAVLEMTLTGNRVTIRRTQDNKGYICDYTGTITGSQVGGTFGCNKAAGPIPWRATIEGGGAAHPPPPSTQAGSLLGCFKDPNTPFDLDGHLERSAQNTPQRCVEVCAAKGFKYAGVQYAQSCLCGNTYGKFGAASNCNMACTGDRNQICGGSNANSVYATGR